ncbi:formylmethanofuran dehydrogenase subunit A [Candidatus Bathyarchaeota archaeon]|nr:formylmethanofuran dehydrogenase subunit A [Candidatus Bathyarchaeota archaeon]
MSREIAILNGTVFDPTNRIFGERMDIFVKDGKIVGSASSKAQRIDASGKVVMPGGVDIHSHIAGSKVNSGRLLRPEDHRKDVEVKTPTTHSGVGYSIPSTYTTGYRYAKMGYTTVFEPATPPLKTRHTHEELDSTPIIDKGCFPLFGNNWFVMEYLRDGKVEECATYVAWMLKALKGYAIKIVDPGGVEVWGWGKFLRHLDEKVTHFNVTPREIIRGLCKVNRLLNLPHPIHVHTNNLGNPGNYTTTIETMDTVRDMANGSKPIVHITHVQFTGFSGSSWLNLGSGAPEIAEYVNKHGHVSVDLGQIIFGDTTTMTADGPFQYFLHMLTDNKWVNMDVEVETGSGIVPFQYKRSNYVNAIQWGIGLELALLIKDPWRVFMTTDHPNGGPFTYYPRVIAWLMSRKARERTLSKINRTARRRLTLPSIDREYTLEEIATITRAAPARSLGLKNKGHFGLGADADIAVYDINPSDMDVLRRKPAKLRRAFGQACYTIKNGAVVVRDGKILKSPFGRTFYVESQTKPEIESNLLRSIETRFRDYYTVGIENYQINESYLRYPAKVRCEAEI